MKNQSYRLRESVIEKEVIKQAKQDGWSVWKWGLQGNPDRIFIKNGRVVFIEFKSPGEKPTPNQKLVIGELKYQKCEVYVIDNIAEGKKILNII